MIELAVLVLQCLPIAIAALLVMPAAIALLRVLRHYRERATWHAAHRIAPLVRLRRRRAAVVAPYFPPLIDPAARDRIDRLYRSHGFRL